MDSISVQGQSLAIREFTGKVMQANKQRELHVSGGGGGGTTINGHGQTAPVSITSSTTTHDDVFLQNDQGKEHVMRLQNWNLACREGHVLKAMWLGTGSPDQGHGYVAIANQSTDSVEWNDRALGKAYGKGFYAKDGYDNVGLALFSAPAVLSLLMGMPIIAALPLLLLPYWAWNHNRKRAAFIADGKRQLQQIL